MAINESGLIYFTMAVITTDPAQQNVSKADEDPNVSIFSYDSKALL